MNEKLQWNTPTPADQRSFSPEQVFEAGLRHHHIANTAYPIHHQTTMRAYRVPRSEIEPLVQAAWQGIDRLGLYVHVPFCKARCKYCEYTVVDRSEHESEDAYFDALMREFDLYRERLDTTRKTLIGFDVGGGTPSFVKPAHIRRVVETARDAFRFEPGVAISIETTPIIADREPEKMCAYREMGIERISMGVQTTHAGLARSLEREYEGPTMLERAVRHIREADFHRFNIDLMYGFADQSPEGWQATVAQTIGLDPEYITLYRVRYKGTRIQDQAARVTREQVNELETIARELLLAAGYAGTPGKNTYSRVPGDVGTSDYLTERVVKGTPYLGLGLGAQSLSHHTLSYNLGAATKTLKPYLRAVDAGRLPIQDIYHLPLDVAMAKMIAVSFYFGEIHREHFRHKFGVRLEDHFSREVAFVLARGLMEYAGPYLRLTPEGATHFNGVVALFYAGAVKEYLVNLEAEERTQHTVGQQQCNSRKTGDLEVDGELETIERLLGKYGHLSRARWVGTSRKLLGEDRAQFWARVDSLDWWGGSGSMADLHLYSPDQTIPDNEQSEDNHRFQGALVSIYEEMVKTGRENERGRACADTFRAWRRQGF